MILNEKEKKQLECAPQWVKDKVAEAKCKVSEHSSFLAVQFLKDWASGQIWCPYCEALVVDDEHTFVSYYGTDEDFEPRTTDCPSCEREFIVKEFVARTYETEKVS